MSDEFKNMDDSFRQMADQLKVKYDASFWDEAKSQLEDDSLDDAFRAAAVTGLTVPSFENISEDLADSFMDEAFVSAFSGESVQYHSDYWEGFQAIEGDLQLDEAFIDAANSVGVSYEPHFWGEADMALQDEGLHYEYNTSYWNEAKRMLDKADRRIFFFKWSAVAAVLLLLSFGGIKGLGNDVLVLDQNSTIAESNEIIGSENLAPDFDLVSHESLKNIVLAQINDYKLRNNLSSDNELTVSNEDQTQQILLVDAGSSIVENGNLSTMSQPNEITAVDLNSANTEEVYQDKGYYRLDLLEGEFGVLALGVESPLAQVVANKPVTKFDLTESNVEFEKYFLSSVNSLGIYGHAGLGNKYGYPDFVPSLRSTIGIEYLNTSYRRHKHLEFGASFAMNHIRQNTLGTERRVNVYTQEGGVNKSWLKLQLRDMFYANANFLFNYRLNDKNKVKFGVGVERLISVKSNMSYQLNGDEEITTVNDNWGVKEGVNPWDVRLSIGYEYQLTNAFSLQLCGNYGLLDRTDNEFLLDNSRDHEMNVTFGLKYTFMHKM